MRLTKIAAILALVATPAFGIIVDSEPNNTPPLASPVTFAEFGGPFARPAADVGLGSLAIGDVDYYSIVLNAGDIISAITTPLGNPANFASPDTLLGIFSPGGALIGFNDDAGSDFIGGGSVGPIRGSAIRYQALQGGTYYMAVTGFGDPAFTGANHVQSGPYMFEVSIVPEPTTIGLLLAGFGLVARRRK